MLWNGVMQICEIFSNKCGDNLRMSRFQNYGKIEGLILENVKSWNSTV